MKYSKPYLEVVLLITTTAAAIVSARVLVDSNNKAYSQTILDQSMNLKHNMFVSQYIPLTGQLKKGDFILLMDFTTFKTDFGHNHIAIKVPCDSIGNPKVTILIGRIPMAGQGNLTSLNVGKPLNNAILNGKAINLSNKGTSCIYHTMLPDGITDIDMANTSNETLSFDKGGYSVAISAHTTSPEMMAMK